MANAIVWVDLVDRRRRTLLRAGHPGVKGKVQFDDYVLQVLARELVDYATRPSAGRVSGLSVKS